MKTLPFNFVKHWGSKKLLWDLFRGCNTTWEKYYLHALPLITHHFWPSGKSGDWWCRIHQVPSTGGSLECCVKSQLAVFSLYPSKSAQWEPSFASSQDEWDQAVLMTFLDIHEIKASESHSYLMWDRSYVLPGQTPAGLYFLSRRLISHLLLSVTNNFQGHCGVLGGQSSHVAIPSSGALFSGHGHCLHQLSLVSIFTGSLGTRSPRDPSAYSFPNGGSVCPLEGPCWPLLRSYIQGYASRPLTAGLLYPLARPLL